MLPEIDRFQSEASDANCDFCLLQKRFGRYPHRNKLLGRTNTEEEEEYLKDYDNLPVWAKSQMKSYSSL